ncbi:sensor domain-containing diguanylate cyclase [bacterium]|nr:sensor domain-containing diguanylate cyclase [bacterium]
MDDQIQNLQQQLKDLQDRFEEIEGAYGKLKERYTQIDSLYTITSSLSTILDFDELLKYTKNVFKNSIKTDQYSLMLFEGSSDRLTIKSSFGIPPESLKLNNFSQKGTIFHEALSRGETIDLTDVSSVNTAEYLPNLEMASGSFLCVPLLLKDNRALGLLNLFRKAEGRFTVSEREFVSKIAQQLAHTLNKVQIYEHTKELSITDDLTGIFNRRYFYQRFEREIQRAKRYKHSLSILMLDLDNFKTYNDINGHIQGDEVLKRVAIVLEKILRKTDLIARFGGEEFIIMLPEISTDQSGQVANKLRQKIEKTTFDHEETLPGGRITISIGFSVFPQDSREPQKLIQFADEALYRAKSMGRNCVVWHGRETPLSPTHGLGSPQERWRKDRISGSKRI